MASEYTRPDDPNLIKRLEVQEARFWCGWTNQPISKGHVVIEHNACDAAMKFAREMYMEDDFELDDLVDDDIEVGVVHTIDLMFAIHRWWRIGATTEVVLTVDSGDRHDHPKEPAHD